MRTGELHGAFLAAVQPDVVHHSDVDLKPLEVDLGGSLPPRLRCYIYGLVVGGPKRRGEYKAVLRVPKHPVGEYRSFEQSDGRVVIVAAYRPEFDVWVLWDALLHPRFKNGGNIQVKDTIVLEAATVGWAEQNRLLASGEAETVIACTSGKLSEGLRRRVLVTTSSWDPGN